MKNIFVYCVAVFPLVSFAADPTSVRCYRTDQGKKVLYVLLEKSSPDTYALHFNRYGQKTTIRDLTCQFSKRLTHVFSCKGPDFEGSGDFRMDAELFEQQKYYAATEKRETTVMVNRIKTNKEASGFDLEGYLLSFYNSSGEFEGVCEAKP